MVGVIHPPKYFSKVFSLHISIYENDPSTYLHYLYILSSNSCCAFFNKTAQLKNIDSIDIDIFAAVSLAEVSSYCPGKPSAGRAFILNSSDLFDVYIFI